MDYTTQALTFKVRKTARYVRLYGPRRAAVKVQGQYHLKRRFDVLPEISRTPADSQDVALIGAGNYAFTTIAYFLTKNFGSVIRTVMDVDVHRAASLAKHYAAARYTVDPDEVLDDPKVRVIFIASNHASHAQYAIEALKRGKHVHVEKPHVVNRDQLEQLCAAVDARNAEVRLGFNRPLSPLGKQAAAHLGRASGPAVYNWFVAGHEIPADHWYYSPSEGGRVLGNLCHWTDFVLRLVPAEGRYPIRVVPARAMAPDCDISVSFVFGDGTVSAITFSAKGHAFEGVKERFAAHRGDVLLTLDDFQSMDVHTGARHHHYRRRFRDHGHEQMIKRSYALGAVDARSEDPADDAAYVWETGDLFLAAKTALDSDSEVTVRSYRS